MVTIVKLKNHLKKCNEKNSGFLGSDMKIFLKFELLINRLRTTGLNHSSSNKLQNH